ncbi:MAG: N-acetylglucosaminyl transferase [Ignavibacteria bacterium]|nr:MAG: N-acetylglucosaminyl transferase [Ignavibacteria bacterium]KAF0161246.1 MAG: N-acetylglucosaminyl transferase [Ignavibacteria bacterium]
MSKQRTPYRFIFAGGGTGGHLYPALAVAQQIREIKPEAEILFIGAKGKIEERVVPEHNFKFKTIWISGFARRFNMSNILFPVKILISLIQSICINFGFKPRVAIGSGAYVSGPVTWAASIIGAKVILLEQNSYPGVTNRLLEKKATEIHITFEESKKYFREQSKLKLTGNPIRINLKLVDRMEAFSALGLKPDKKTLLIIGGSGGAKSLNTAVAKNIIKFTELGIQILWQTGKVYYQEFRRYNGQGVKVMEYISDMSAAYSACDLVLARAGATTIAEVSMLGLPVVFVPSANVAADHQFKNAKTLVDANAAELVEDKNIETLLFDSISKLMFDEERKNSLKKNIVSFAKPNAALEIAQRAIKMAETL